MNAKYSIIACSALVLAAGTLVVAGPLSPGAGPVAGTYKTLTEVEPRIAINATNTPGDADSLFKITQPGSYYLTGNLNGESGKHGIEIAATGVTVDLNGFAVSGVAGSKTGVFFAGSASSSSTVRNGTVRNWGGDGVGYGSTAYYIRVHNVISSSNTGAGITVGSYSEVRDCIAASNGGTGIRIYAIGRAEGCTAHSNGGHGIEAANTTNIIARCVSSGNGLSGFNTASGNTLIDCRADTNNDEGFSVYASRLTNCQSNSNLGYGFFVGNNSIVTSSSAHLNSLDGFSGSDATVIENCQATSNGAGVAGRCGFRLSGTGGKLAGNYAQSNPTGFLVSGLNILAINNTATGNTSAAFTVNANNDTGAVLTNPGVGFTTTNPAANYAP